MGAPGSIACGLSKDVRAGNYFKQKKPATYLIHKDLKPSMIRASERESEGRSEQQINQSDSLILDPSYEHTWCASSLYAQSRSLSDSAVAFDRGLAKA